jgi:phosphate transport system protein
MSEHIVSSYDVDLQNLRRRIAEMGGIAEKMMADAIQALVKRDTPLAQTVIAVDTQLDILQREVEENAILTIARRQPLAVDLRETISAIRVSGDLERIGDLAKNIAKRSMAVSAEIQPQIVVGLQHMFDLAISSRTCSMPMLRETPSARSGSGSGTARSTRSTARFFERCSRT